MRRFLMKTYLRARVHVSPHLWRILYKRGEAEETEFLTLSFSAAEDAIASMPYKSDYLKGLIDCSIPKKYYKHFFKDLKHGRDCDEFARMWTVWGEANGYTAKEYAITDKWFKRAHVFTVLLKSGTCYLMNKYMVGLYSDLDLALEAIGRTYEKPVIVEYYHGRERYDI